MPPFFPHELFGYCFGLVLLVGLVLASWTDLRTLKVPKSITMGLLGAGAIANIVRGGWLGSQGHEVWLLSAGPVPGAFDGLLFSIVGMIVGFGLFFVLWIGNVCGGGDVKLAAAVGAWIGPLYFFGVLVVIVPIVMLLSLLRLGLAMVAGKAASSTTMTGAKPVQPWRLMSYSFPMLLAVLILLAIGYLGARVQFVPQ